MDIGSAERIKIDSIVDRLENILIVYEHRKIAENQREAYNMQRKNKELLKTNILIEVDFKQKIAIVLSPMQINKEYYRQEVRTCLGKLNYL